MTPEEQKMITELIPIKKGWRDRLFFMTLIYHQANTPERPLRRDQTDRLIDLYNRMGQGANT